MQRPAWVAACVAAVAVACGGSPQPVQQNPGPSLHALAVAVSGSGSVRSSPAGIDCDDVKSQLHANCQASFTQGTAVSLSAAAASGFLFSSWDGACTGQGTCVVTLNADAAVTARFTAAPPPPPPATFSVSVSTHGSGAVRSDPAELDCGQICSATFASGTQVKLSAWPAAGWRFTGWSGGCAGAEECTLSGNASVAAQFDQPPPPPPDMRALSVTVQGQGSVTSSPAGISCDEGKSQRGGSTCNASFSDGALVQLTATPASGWQFSGFSGACTGAQCSLTLSADQSLAATFTQLPPPPPADECAGLMPMTLPPPVEAQVSIPCSGCTHATSDDGNGTFALCYTYGSGPAIYPGCSFFQIRGGAAVQVGQSIGGPSEGNGFSIYSQPSGFTLFTIGGNGGSSISTCSHDGAFVSSQTVVSGSFDAYPHSAIGIDPSGGTAAVARYSNQSGWITTYRRFDKSGAPEMAEVVIPQAGPYLESVGVALSGHALVMDSLGGSKLRARWLDRDGSPLTDWFSFTGSYSPTLQFLMDGSLALRDYPSLHWQSSIADGVAATQPVPDWLRQLSGNAFAVVRGGRAYVSWGSGSQCGSGVEVLATSGKSCGCMSVPNGVQSMSFGRDGSLMVPTFQNNTCTWQLYPQLLK